MSIAIILTIISSILAALGQLCLKLGSMKLKMSIPHIIRNFELMIGIVLYGISAVAFIVALKGGELTVLYPIVSLNYIWVNLLSIKFLKEKMNSWKWIGSILIILGVILII